MSTIFTERRSLGIDEFLEIAGWLRCHGGNRESGMWKVVTDDGALSYHIASPELSILFFLKFHHIVKKEHEH